ncbi:MAG: hypothetical protein AAGA65_16555 [Actinomycetota bacterium]
MGGPPDHPDFNVEQLYVAEAIEDVDGDARAVRYVLGSKADLLDSSVEEIIDQLCQSGDAELLPGKMSARLTSRGRERLALTQNWSFEVLDTFTVLRASEYPLLRGRLHSGVVRIGDRFLDPAGELGTVTRIEFAFSTTFAPDETLVLGVGRSGFAVGDLLTRFEVLAGTT